MNKPAIVTIAYNRPDSLGRLLSSLGNAKYPEGSEVTLVISIDKSDTDEVVRLAQEYEWPFGEKVVIARKERMGLKNHVLACGDLTDTYGSIIVLEDDLYVSPSFYEYAVKALDFTEGDERIGGVSLYNHLFNVHARRSFMAIDDGYDNWYFQFASSWGQAYTKSQWDGFKEWYAIHKDEPIGGAFVPANVATWSERSWLKYYIAYLIDTDKYFLYPKVSFTTNFGDVGSHAVKADADLQVPIAGRVQGLYCAFAKLDESDSIYDAFFENVRLAGPDRDVIVDLYGSKPINEMLAQKPSVKYVLSSQGLPFETVESYGRQMRPVDANIVYKVTGNDFRLYDISRKAEAPSGNDEAVSYLYEYRGISAKQMMQMIKYRISEKLRK